MISMKLKDYTKNDNKEVTLATGDDVEGKVIENVIYRVSFQKCTFLTGCLKYSEQIKSFSKCLRLLLSKMVPKKGIL